MSNTFSLRQWLLPRGRRLAGPLRVGVYLSVVGLGLSCWLARSAYADAERSIGRLGERLVAELGPSIVGPPQAFTINGQILMLASKQSELSVREVLDRFDASCASTNPRSELAMLPGVTTDTRASPELRAWLRQDPARFGLLRAGSDDEGHLSCLAQPKDRRGLAAVVEAFKRFADSGDLSHLGHVRYVRARKLPNGRTHVIALWSESEFRLGAMFPDAGDAPGSDMPSVPRPPDSKRELYATVAGQSYALRLYDSTRPSAEVLRFYDRELPKTGWHPVPTPLPNGELRPGVFARAFTREGRAVAIAVEPTPQGKTGISLIDLGVVRRSTSTRSASLAQ